MKENIKKEQEHICKTIENCDVVFITTVENGKRWLWCYTKKKDTRKEKTVCHEIKYCPYCGKSL